MKFKFLIGQNIIVATGRWIPFSYITHCTIQYKIILTLYSWVTLYSWEAACVRVEGWIQARQYRSQGRAGAASGSGQPAAHPFTQGGQAHVDYVSGMKRYVALLRPATFCGGIILWLNVIWLEFYRIFPSTLSLTLTETMYYVNIDADCNVLPNKNAVYTVLRSRTLNLMNFDTDSHRHLVFIKNCILLYAPCILSRQADIGYVLLRLATFCGRIILWPCMNITWMEFFIGMYASFQHKQKHCTT
jgi:hypothetical protein